MESLLGHYRLFCGTIVVMELRIILRSISGLSSPRENISIGLLTFNAPSVF